MWKYLNSQLHKLPFNNKSASFGSASGGNQWNKEIDVDNTPDFIEISWVSWVGGLFEMNQMPLEEKSRQFNLNNDQSKLQTNKLDR